MRAAHLTLAMAAVATSMHERPIRTVQSAASSRTTQPLMENRWMQAQRKRREEEEARYEQLAKARAKEEESRRERAAAEQEQKRRDAEERSRRAAAFQDGLDVSRPGDGIRQPTPVITRETLANAQKTTSPALNADEALKVALQEVGTLDTRAACDLLKQRMADARAAGLRESMPNFKKAQALLNTLELTAASEAELKQAGFIASKEADPSADAM